VKKIAVVKGIALLAMAAVMGGCAVGQKINYSDTQLNLDAAGKGAVAVTAVDSRSYVKNGEKDREYVGNFRGGFGNPFNVKTASGNPLADDFSSVICGSYKNKGIPCTAVSVEPNEAPAAVLQKLKATKAQNLMVLTMKEWMSSTFSNTGLTYDLDLAVVNGDGTPVADKQVKGEDDLGGSAWNPPAHAKEAVPVAFKNKLETLLNDPAVVKALK